MCAIKITISSLLQSSYLRGKTLSGRGSGRWRLAAPDFSSPACTGGSGGGAGTWSCDVRRLPGDGVVLPGPCRRMVGTEGEEEDDEDDDDGPIMDAREPEIVESICCG